MSLQTLSPGNEASLPRIAALLGGEPVLHRTITEPMDAHEMILDGLPGRALLHLMDGFVLMPLTESLEKAVGISLRTFQRRKDAPDRPLSAEQSGRTWKFAEILDWATRVFGTREGAELWLYRKATGLNQQRPIDLLTTPAGVRSRASRSASALRGSPSAGSREAPARGHPA